MTTLVHVMSVFCALMSPHVAVRHATAPRPSSVASMLAAAFDAPAPALVDGVGTGATFGPLAVPEALAERLRGCGFTHPMPIQSQAMPRIAAGENVVIHSATGSGKTLAYLVPLLAALSPGDGVRVLIATPSQELAVQIAAEAERLHPGLGAVSEDGSSSSSAGRSSGGVLLAISSSRETELEQQDALFSSARPPQLIVGTPQRLADLARHPRARPVLRSVRTVVLDEVDLMLPPLAPGTVAGGGRGGRGGRGGLIARGRSFGGPRGRGRARPNAAGEGYQGRGTRRDTGAVYQNAAIGARLARPRPAEIFFERLRRSRPRSAPPLQLVSCSATVTADLRRRLGALQGGTEADATKQAAGVVVTAAPAHPIPKSVKRMGVGGVAMPSTIRHSAYLGKPAGLDQMLLTAFAELQPNTALLVIPNGHSVPKRVEALRKLGFEKAEALQDALGVPAATAPEERSTPVANGATSADDEPPTRAPSSAVASTGRPAAAPVAPRRRATAGETLQGEMIQKRQQLASAFARREAAVPLLVTTEHSARGIDFKDLDVVFLVGLPARVDSYVHVAGRTAREGRKGRAVCLLTEEDDFNRLADFGRELGIQVEKIDLRFLTGRS
jgi:hypothetical protein